jgi:hypothetical protein
VRDRKEPCGTLACISLGLDSSPSAETLNILGEREKLIRMARLIENFNSDKLYSNSMCHVVSNAFSISKDTAPVDIIVGI